MKGDSEKIGTDSIFTRDSASPSFERARRGERKREKERGRDVKIGYLII